jgi:hypothetical protein
LLAFAPLFVSSLAFAQSREEYDAQVEAVEARISAAQEALQDAQTAYNSALATGVSLDSEIAQAAQNLANAQAAYDQSQIPDPSWVRPTKEIQVSEEITTTTQVPVTTTTTTTQLVPRTISVVVPSGLTAKSYNMLGFNNMPPLPTENRLVSTEIVPNIDFQWGGGFILNSGLHEDVVVQFTGKIFAPTEGVYGFYSPADDGTKLIINGNLIIDDWYDKGGGGSMTQIYLTQGSHDITLWYYENGGGANVWLYWAKPGYGFEIVPASAFGEQVQETTVYDEITVTEEVTAYVEETTTEIIYSTEIVPDEGATHPLIKDASLLPTILSAQTLLNNLVIRKNENGFIIESASNDVITAQEELRVAQQELEAIPPFREPTPTPTETESTPEEPTEPEPEPLPEPEQTETPEPESESELRVDEAVSEIENLVEINPEELTESQVEELVAAAMVVFETTEKGSEEYNQALEALAVAAQADDPNLPEELAAIPLLGDAAGAALEVLNDLGNVGADMSPQVREESEKTIIASVIAAGAAINAVSAAAVTATSSGGGASRRIN